MLHATTLCKIRTPLMLFSSLEYWLKSELPIFIILLNHLSVRLDKIPSITKLAAHYNDKKRAGQYYKTA